MKRFTKSIPTLQKNSRSQMPNIRFKRIYDAKVLLKILSIALGGKPRTRAKNLRINIDKWKDLNQGRYALVKDLDLDALFVRDDSAVMAM